MNVYLMVENLHHGSSQPHVAPLENPEHASLLCEFLARHLLHGALRSVGARGATRNGSDLVARARDLR